MYGEPSNEIDNIEFQYQRSLHVVHATMVLERWYAVSGLGKKFDSHHQAGLVQARFFIILWDFVDFREENPKYLAEVNMKRSCNKII